MSAKITAALHQVMLSCGYVQKTGRNAFHNYRYAGEADLLEKLRPAMLEAGLLLLPSVEEVSPIDEHGITTVRMSYTLAHKDGDIWPHKLFAAGAGGDKNKTGVGDKGLYKAITGANKYLLFKLFQIETGDDPEKDEAAPRAEPAGNGYAHVVNRMLKAISEKDSGPMLEALVTTSGWRDHFVDIPDDQQERVVAAIQARREQLKQQRIPA